MKDNSLLVPPAVSAPISYVVQRSMHQMMLALAMIVFSIPAFGQDGRKVKFSIQPEYPELAKKNNIQGATRLQVLIAMDGSIKEIKVLGGSPVLAQAAIDAVKKWKYEPASQESTAVLKFEFRP